MITFDLDISLTNSSLQDKDKTIVLADMTWDNYQELLEKNSNYRISYFAGIITIMSPSRNHERIAETISILINAYCRKYSINYFALGSSDIKNPPVSGKQPDTSYCFESEKEIPDLAVEVVFSSGGTADLKKYQVLKVKEVWFWENNKIQFYYLKDSGYVEIKISNCLNQLSANFLTQFVNRGLIESNLIIETDFINEL
ncbi:MAG: Uma2 family endonuclease [Waterburya sp.]